MKIALGMIVKSLDSDAEIMRFIDNAEKHGHKLDCVIVAYALRLDPQAHRSISNRVPFYPVNINNPGFAIEEFRRRGISGGAAGTLLKCPTDTGRGVVPYGFNRNIVTIEAILRGVDVLFFVDSDVYPAVLYKDGYDVAIEDVDFFGAHLGHIGKGAQITTGEYSGYNILPPAAFEGMEDLLVGLQKADMIEYWQTSGEHRCLTTRPEGCDPKPCTKILGGNVAVRLSVFSELPPFFSSHYMLGDEMFLCRGEDTVLGLAIESKGVTCTDIGLYPLHNTYDTYPLEPDLRKDPAVQQRFYYACTGWVGRNPFLNYLKGADLDSAKECRREQLERGLRALSEYTSNPKYRSVLRNFSASWSSLGRYINEYEQMLEAWDELRTKTDMI